MKSDHCRGCFSQNLTTLFDFGKQPLAGVYPAEPQSVRPAKRYALELAQCADCALLQVVKPPPIEEVFHSDYRYSSSTIPGLVNHFASYAGWLRRYVPESGRIFEFGCNDGVLLERLQASGISCSGIDASDNVASIARSKGLSVDTGFLTEEYVRNSRGIGRYDLVTCSNVFAHIHDLRAALNAVRMLLKSDGWFSVEVHNGEYIVSQSQFDTIYHEHLTYFTEQTLKSLLERYGFDFVLCERTSMHGGGLRCLMRKSSRGDTTPKATLSGMKLERADSISRPIERCRVQLRTLYEQHGPLVGYGAAGRSQMFINFTDSERYFSRVYDDSPFRQGRYIVGTDIPIVEFKGEFAKCVVVLAWNYADDIGAKVRRCSDRTVALLPEFRTC